MNQKAGSTVVRVGVGVARAAVLGGDPSTAVGADLREDREETGHLAAQTLPARSALEGSFSAVSKPNF